MAIRWEDIAWNPSPKVASARDIGNKWDFDQVIIIGINNDKCEIEAITFGRTKSSCAEAETYGDVAYDAVMNHIIENL